MTRKKKVWTIFMVALVAVGSWSAYCYHDRAVNQWLLTLVNKGRGTNGVNLYFTSSIDAKTLRVRLTVLCKSRQQRREVLKKEPRILHGLVSGAQNPSFVASVLGRDLGALRKHLLKTINGETDSPVKAVYLDRFFFN